MQRNAPTTFGDRIRWTRLNLGLKISQVTHDLGIKPRIFFYWEQSVHSPKDANVILNITKYYDQKWNAKFYQDFPKFNDQEIKKITMEFLIDGAIDENELVVVLQDNIKKTKKDMVDLILRRSTK